MTSAHMQHVVGDVGAGHVGGDHRHTVSAARAGGLRYVFAADQRRGCDRIVANGLGLAHHLRGLLHRRDGELEVKNRRGVRSDGHRLLLVSKRDLLTIPCNPQSGRWQKKTRRYRKFVGFETNQKQLLSV